MINVRIFKEYITRNEEEETNITLEVYNELDDSVISRLRLSKNVPYDQARVVFTNFVMNFFDATKAKIVESAHQQHRDLWSDIKND